MSLLLQKYTSAQYYINSWRHEIPKKTSDALKLEILSSATINTAAIIHPVQTHAEVVLYAIASRDADDAAAIAAQYQFQKSYGSYDALILDRDVDFVYISLPNALHFEWAFKALDAGKHVLVEKPFTSNAKEAEILVDKARECGKILMEACAWEFHPAAHRFRQLLVSQQFGGIISTSAGMSSTPPIPSADIRWNYNLSGGSLMDMCNVLSLTRFALHGGTSHAVVHASATLSEEDPRVDSSMLATVHFKLPNVNPRSSDSDVYSTIYTDMARQPAYGLVPRVWELPAIRVEMDLADVYFYNAVMPDIYHYISITDKANGSTKYERMYNGGPLWRDRGKSYWSAYRYQLEAFVDKLRGRNPVWWISGEDSITQMKIIDAIYRESGLPLRPTSANAAG